MRRGFDDSASTRNSRVYTPTLSSAPSHSNLPIIIPKSKAQTKNNVDQDDEVEMRASLRFEQSLKKFNSLNQCRVKTAGEKMHQFIYHKKLQNPVLFTEKSRINHQALPVHRGTISVMLNVQKKDAESTAPNFKGNISKKARFKIKWKTIQWLMDYKKDAISSLCRKYDEIIEKFRDRGSVLTRAEFGELMSMAGLGGEKAVVDKLFYVFDDDNSGDIDYREMITGLELFRESPFDEKLKVFFDLCDADRSGTLTKKEIYDVLKRSMAYDEEKADLWKTINLIFSEVDKARTDCIEKSEFFAAAVKSKNLRSILEESMKAVKRVDKIIENDLEEPFQAWMPISGSLINYKEGIHFPTSKILLKMAEENEKIRFQTKMMKQEFNDKYMSLKAGERTDVDESDDEY